MSLTHMIPIAFVLSACAAEVPPKGGSEEDKVGGLFCDRVAQRNAIDFCSADFAAVLGGDTRFELNHHGEGGADVSFSGGVLIKTASVGSGCKLGTTYDLKEMRTPVSWKPSELYPCFVRVPLPYFTGWRERYRYFCKIEANERGFLEARVTTRDPTCQCTRSTCVVSEGYGI